jgi:hypothetical protein
MSKGAHSYETRRNGTLLRTIGIKPKYGFLYQVKLVITKKEDRSYESKARLLDIWIG